MAQIQGDTRKADELTFMLQSRIKANSSAYSDKILYKSELVKELSEEYQNLQKNKRNPNIQKMAGTNDPIKESQTPEQHRLRLESTTEQQMATLRQKEIEERTLQNSWGSDVLAPSYWTYDDIAQWKEMVGDSEVGHDAEIVSLLDFVTEAAKVINGDKQLDYINNLENITLPHRIESMEQLVAEEKENRLAAYEYFQKERRKLDFDPIEAMEEAYNTPWNPPTEADIEAEKQREEAYIQSELDKTVEDLQANGGLSNAAAEADYNASLAENQEIAEEENEDVYTMFLDADKNPHYPQEIVSALEEFSKVEPEKWNLPATDKTAVFHLIDIAQIKDGDFENSVKKITDYLNSEEYEHHQENYAKIFTPILLTNVGQDFDAETHTFSSDKFSYAFSTDDIQNEQTEEKKRYELSHPADALIYTSELTEKLDAVNMQLEDYYLNGKVPENSRFILPNTPDFMQRIGSDDTAISLPVSVVKKARDVHGLSLHEIQDAVKKLYDPVVVFDSDKSKSESNADSRLILTDAFKSSETGIKPIAFAVSVNSMIQEQVDGHRKFVEVQDIRSIHDRTLIAKNGTDLIQKWTNDGLCRYVDDKKITDWSTVARVYFPIEVLQSDKNTILQKSQIVNTPAQRGAVKSIHENDFHGNNLTAARKFQDKLIASGAVNAEEKFVLVTELEAHAKGTEIKKVSKNDYVILNMPVLDGEKTKYVPVKYYHVSALEEPQKVLRKEPQEKAPEPKEPKIEFGRTKISKLALMTNHGFKRCEDMTVQGFDSRTNTYLLESAEKETVKVTDKDGNEIEKEIPKHKIHVQASTMEVLLSDERKKALEEVNALIAEKQKGKEEGFEKILGEKEIQDLAFKKEKLEEGMIVTQYKDFFETRSNTANSFRHNLAVMCRKEANSPLDALKVARNIISQMPNDEKKKTRDLLKLLSAKDQSMNEVIVGVYHDAVKETPLNENYLLSARYDKVIARPMYDTLSTKGERIDGEFNLKIGDTVRMNFNVGKNMVFESGRKPIFGRKDHIYSECKIVSSSKEGNKVTLMDGNKSFYDVPRDTFLKEYARREKIERKQEKKMQRGKSIVRLDIER